MLRRLRALLGSAPVASNPVYGVDQGSRLYASLGAVTAPVSPMSRGTAVLPIGEAKSGMVFPAMQHVRGAADPVGYPQNTRVSSIGQLPDQKGPGLASGLDVAAAWMTAGQTGLGSLGSV